MYKVEGLRRRFVLTSSPSSRLTSISLGPPAGRVHDTSMSVASTRPPGRTHQASHLDRDRPPAPTSQHRHPLADPEVVDVRSDGGRDRRWGVEPRPLPRPARYPGGRRARVPWAGSAAEPVLRASAGCRFAGAAYWRRISGEHDALDEGGTVLVTQGASTIWMRPHSSSGCGPAVVKPRVASMVVDRKLPAWHWQQSVGAGRVPPRAARRDSKRRRGGPPCA